jgi:hypothetical protein
LPLSVYPPAATQCPVVLHATAVSPADWLLVAAFAGSGAVAAVQVPLTRVSITARLGPFPPLLA